MKGRRMADNAFFWAAAFAVASIGIAAWAYIFQAIF